MKTIAWDVDDTLNDLMRAWLAGWNRSRAGTRRAAYADLRENPPHKILCISPAAYLRSYDAFRLSGAYAALPPDKEVLRWFRQRGAGYRHIAVTSVPLRAAHESAGWVYRNFGRWIRTFHVVPSLRQGELAPAYDATKADFLRRIGGCDIFVDDSPENIRQVRALGARCLLAPRPWNGQKGGMAGLLRTLT